MALFEPVDTFPTPSFTPLNKNEKADKIFAQGTGTGDNITWGFLAGTTGS